MLFSSFWFSDGCFYKKTVEKRVRKTAIGKNVILCSDIAEKTGVLVVIRELGYLAGTQGSRSLDLESPNHSLLLYQSQKTVSRRSLSGLITQL